MKIDSGGNENILIHILIPIPLLSMTTLWDSCGILTFLSYPGVVLELKEQVGGVS
jgi:hypothetical protein